MCPARLLTETKKEATEILRDLIRIDTTNPPGNETEAAKYVAESLEKDGFECELLESARGRGSVVTRLKGKGNKPSVLLLSHLDVVSANPKEWSVDPFGGVLKDGFVWGRGALDMKSMTAMEMMVMKLLKRDNSRLKGDLLFAATADEEKGGEAGAGWLSRKHPGKIKADYVLNEGGGWAMKFNRRNIYTVQTAEKGILWFKIRAKGTPGHGSIPGSADSAIERTNRVIGKLQRFCPGIMLTPAVKEFLSAIAQDSPLLKNQLRGILKDPEKADAILDEMAKKDRFFAEEIRVKLRMTLTPTMIHGGVKENIIPSECETVFDCRILPGQTTRAALDTVRNLLKEEGLDKLEFEVIQANEPSESQLHTPMYEEIRATLAQYDPGCTVASDMLTGGTDSRFLRRMGSVCYGFQPVSSKVPYSEMKKSIHGIDERISVDDLVFGTSVLHSVVERFLS